MTTWTVLTARRLVPVASGTAYPAAPSGWDCLCRVSARDSESAGRLARMRRRIDAFLTEMLDDDADENRQDPGPGIGVHQDEPAGLVVEAPPETRPARGHRSKHRLNGAPKNALRSDAGRRGRPRHAAPPASFRAGLGAAIAFSTAVTLGTFVSLWAVASLGTTPVRSSTGRRTRSAPQQAGPGLAAALPVPAGRAAGGHGAHAGGRNTAGRKSHAFRLASRRAARSAW